MSDSVKYRLGGVILLLVGLAVGWFFLVGPLQAAQGGAAEVSYSLRAFIAVPLCLVFGLGFLAMGPALHYRNDAHTNLSVTGWVLFAVVALLTAAGYVWFQQQFTALGYVS
ncbi:hypothetical protein [uncultured Devosia sp.]|uniref:hypothetical protein n=1 Tax=uncultured Devosia sp. TaxID=211434 RepID=UPI0035CBF896